MCVPPRAITQNANHAPAEPTIMTSTIGTALSPPEVARGAAMPFAIDWNTPITDDAVPACSRASPMACAPELPKINAFAVMMSAKPTHVRISGRSRRNVEIASVTTPVAAIVRPVMMSVRGVHSSSASFSSASAAASISLRVGHEAGPGMVEASAPAQLARIMLRSRV